MNYEMFVLLLLFFVYFLLHSLFASLRIKSWVECHIPSITPFYRIGYNLFAVLSLLPILIFMVVWRGETIIRWDGDWFFVMNGIALLALMMFYHSTRYYDMSEFLGTRQVMQPQTDTNTSRKVPLCISPYHRFVRHPWYAFGLMLIWTREMDQLQLIASMAITLYFVVGSYLEEKKLTFYYGEEYLSYRAKVPGLIPLPWKYLNRADFINQ